MQQIVKELPVNEKIRVKEVRLVGDNGEQLGIMPVVQALEIARKQNLDLVMVAPNAAPPVCRILDYGKYKYTQERKERELRKGQKTVDIREIRLRPKIGDHDFEAKVRVAKKLLNGGDKIRIVVLFRGREITHPDLGAKLLERMVESLKGIVGIEKQPLLEGKRLTMVITPLPSHRQEVKEKTEARARVEPKEAVEVGERVKEIQDAKA
jgi:translation initiation factor IF-3